MMNRFLKTRTIRRAVAASAILAAGTIAAPAWAADDLPLVDDIQIGPIEMPSLDGRDRPLPPDRRLYDERSDLQRPDRPGPYGYGSHAAIPSARFARPLDARPMLPPVQVVSILRATGYSPLGRITQRGWIYTVAVLDPGGDDGRLIIDARTGRILRFIPALAVDPDLNERMAAAYGPPGPPPVADARYDTRRGSLLDLRHAPRPAAPVPKATQRAASKAAGNVAPPATTGTAPARQAGAPSGAPSDRTAENRSATTVGAARTSAPASPAPAAAPATLQLWPTQAMPDVQTLE